MAEIVYRFMDARTLMNLIAGNWASFQGDFEPEERESDGLLAVDIPKVRFEPDRDSVRAKIACRGGVVALDIEPLIEDEDFIREGGQVFVNADVLVAEPVQIELMP